MKIEGKISILFDREGLRIEIEDATAHVRFVSATLDMEQTCSAMSRLGSTPCTLDVRGLENVGKEMEHKQWEFKLPAELSRYTNRDALSKYAQINCPEGWTCAGYFGSQNSYFDKDGEPWARTTIRRWI